jgi:hypothetical protein
MTLGWANQPSVFLAFRCVAGCGSEPVNAAGKLAAAPETILIADVLAPDI